MNTSTAVLEHPVNGAAAPATPTTARTPEPLLREALGLTLRAFRADKGVTPVSYTHLTLPTKA